MSGKETIDQNQFKPACSAPVAEGKPPYGQIHNLFVDGYGPVSEELLLNVWVFGPQPGGGLQLQFREDC